MTRLAAAALAFAVLTGCGVHPAAPRALTARAAAAAKAPAARPAPQPADAVFAQLDTDRDGRVTFAELLAGPFGQPAGGWAPGQKEAEARAAMRVYDRDGDGAVTPAEFRAAWGRAIR